MAFVKLDCGILDSSIWPDRPAREMFITALLMAEPYEVTEPTDTIKIRTLESAGFTIPPGWYGFVAAASIGIARRAGIENEDGLSALERLANPELESRTPSFDGRRLVRIDGGFIVLNYEIYRKKDHTSAERSKRYRARQLSPATASLVPNVAIRVASRKHKHKHTKEEIESSPCVTRDGDAIMVHWNATASLPRCLVLSQKRRVSLAARLRDAFFAANWKEAIDRAGRSQFCCGVNDRGWKATFDWFLQPDVVAKIMEGKYDGLPSAGSAAPAGPATLRLGQMTFTVTQGPSSEQCGAEYPTYLAAWNTWKRNLNPTQA